ncbi:universal stress protein, partial [Streptomyces galilaeus]|uniref:universal stress protein n=1 Tax=Streptomyces galilaeus TaxID=33899 RepID=UPI0038F6B33D
MTSIAVGQGYDNTLLMETMQRQSDDLKKVCESILSDIKFDFSTEVGYPTDEILKKVGEYKCDLLIMGTHGRTGLDHLLIG